MKTLLTVLILSFFLPLQLKSQVTGEYRTSGNSSFWGEDSAWEIFDGVNWVTPGHYPNSGNHPKITINHDIILWDPLFEDNMNLSFSTKLINNSTLTIGINNGPTQTFTGRLNINKGVDKNFINNGILKVFGELELNSNNPFPNLDSTFLNFGTVEFIALQNADTTSGCLKGQGGFVNYDTVRFYNGSGIDIARDICFFNTGVGLDVKNHGYMQIASMRETIRVIGLPITIYSDGELEISAFLSNNKFNIQNDGNLYISRALPVNTFYSFSGKLFGNGIAELNSNLPEFRLTSYNDDTLRHNFSIPGTSRLIFTSGPVWIADESNFVGDGYLGANNVTLNINSPNMTIGIYNFSSTINFLNSDTTRIRKYEQQLGTLNSNGVITVSDSLLLGTVFGGTIIKPSANFIALHECVTRIKGLTFLTSASLILNGKIEYLSGTSIFLQFANTNIENNDSIIINTGMIVNGSGKFINNVYFEVNSQSKAEFITVFENYGLVNIIDGQLFIRSGINKGAINVDDSLFINLTSTNFFTSDSGSVITGNGVFRTFQALINILGEWSFEGFANFDATTINFEPSQSDSVVFKKTRISSASFGFLGLGGSAKKLFTDSVHIISGGFNSGGDVTFTNTAHLRLGTSNARFYGPLNVFIHCNTLDSITNSFEFFNDVNIFNHEVYEIKSNRNSIGSTTARFINNGTIIKNATGIGGFLNTIFENNGTVIATEGTFQINNGFNKGIFHIEDSLRIVNTSSQYVFDTTSNVTGTGSLVTSNTNINILGTWDFSGLLSMTSTDISFNSVSKDTIHIRKAHINNSGFGRIGISGGNVKVFTDTIIHQSGGFAGGGDVIFSETAFYKIIPNNGLTNIGPQNIFINCNSIDSTGTTSSSYNYGSNVNIVNNGHFRKLASNNQSYSNVNPLSTFQNNGTFELSANTSQTNFLSGITFVNNGLLKHNSGTLHFLSNNYTGNGKIEMGNGAIFKIGNLNYGNELLINNGTLDVSTLTFANSIDTIIGTGKVNGLTTIAGGQNVRINGSQQFVNLTVNTGGLLDIVNSVILVSGVLTNNGIIKTKIDDSPVFSRYDIEDYLDANNPIQTKNNLRSLSDTTEIVYNGTTLQTVVPNIEYLILTLDNPAGTVINSPILVESRLNLLDGILDNGNNLTLAPNANVNIDQGSLNSPPVYQAPPDITYQNDLPMTTGNELPDTLQSLSLAGSGDVTLGKNVYVIGNINVIGADLGIDNKIILMSSTSTLLETDTAIVTGGLGYIETTREIDSPVSLNIGGLGVILSSASNMGMTTVRRGHSVSFAGINESIKRYFDIFPANNTGLNATMIFIYNDNELNGIPKNNLVLFRSPDGGLSWTEEGSVNDTSAKTLTLTGIDSFSKWTAGDIDSPLPVSINSFTATVEIRNVLLQWETLWEINNMRFDIQRRPVILPAPLGSGSEESIWNTVGSVTGSGTTQEQKSYSFIDRNLVTGKYEYRLVQIDFDGNSTADHTLSSQVEVGVPTEFTLSQNYPNPFNPTTKIDFQIPVEGLVKLIVYDISGREVATLVNEVKTPGYYQTEFNGANFASGVYFYRLVTNNNVMTKKFMLLK